MKKAVSWLTRPVWSWLELWIIASAWVLGTGHGWLADCGIVAAGVFVAMVVTFLLRKAAKLPPTSALLEAQNQATHQEKVNR